MAVGYQYKYLQRRIRRCGCLDSLYVMWAYSQFLQLRSFQFPADIEKPAAFLADSRANMLIHEWELELLATEAILHGQFGTRSMRDWSTLREIVGKLRKLENDLYGERPDEDVFVELSRILHRQSPWQKDRPTLELLYRYHSIFSDPLIDLICQNSLGISINRLYLQGLTLHTLFAEKPLVKLAADLDPDTASLLTLAALPIGKLRELVAAKHEVDHSFAYQVSVIRRYPLVRVEHDGMEGLMCPLPTLLFWRLTSGLYYDLIAANRDFGNALGTSFQRYIGDVLRKAGTSSRFQIISEAQYGTRQQPKATPDWILSEDDHAALFIECKSKRMTASAKAALGELQPVKDDIDKLADGVVQVYERMRDYEGGHFPNLPYDSRRRCYPVIVTLEDWYLFSNFLPTLLNDAVKEKMEAKGLDLQLIEEAPYTVLSADEFEDVIQVVNKIGIGACFEGKAREPKYRGWMFPGYLGDRFPREWAANQFLFKREAKLIFNRLLDDLTPKSA